MSNSELVNRWFRNRIRFARVAEKFSTPGNRWIYCPSVDGSMPRFVRENDLKVDTTKKCGVTIKMDEQQVVLNYEHNPSNVYAQCRLGKNDEEMETLLLEGMKSIVVRENDISKLWSRHDQMLEKFAKQAALAKRLGSKAGVVVDKVPEQIFFGVPEPHVLLIPHNLSRYEYWEVTVTGEEVEFVLRVDGPHADKLFDQLLAKQ